MKASELKIGMIVKTGNVFTEGGFEYCELGAVEYVDGDGEKARIRRINGKSMGYSMELLVSKLVVAQS